jgi:uncharacterized protein (TIGR00296 family)
MYSDENGKLAVALARASIDKAVKDSKMPDFKIPEIFSRKTGAFVTLNTYPDHELRGCIGYPEPHFSLKDSLINAAEGATRDPRFPRLKENELDKVVVEVSLLTPPELIKVNNPKEYLDKVKIGRDGLIIEHSFFRGLLLPQVPVEWKWDVETYLSHTCMKAGLYPDAWLDRMTKLYRFEAEIFSEEKPRGEVKRKVLDG